MPRSTFRIALLAVSLLAAMTASARALPVPPTPLTQDPIGVLTDVTADAAAYQAASVFCIQMTDVEFAPPPTTRTTSDDPDCAASGFPAHTTGLVRISVAAPPLCEGCRRIFLDYDKIPAEDGAPYYYAHGHYYMRFTSFNGYTIDPTAHSPNVKDFTNDKLFVPDDSPYAPVVSMLETYGIDFTGNTANFVYSATQGPYYTGKWYVSADGRRIDGAYFDVKFPAMQPGGAITNQLGYGALFYSGEIAPCLNSQFSPYQDADGYYGGCIDRAGASATTID